MPEIDPKTTLQVITFIDTWRYSKSCQTFKMVEEGALSKKWLWPGTVSEVHCNMFDMDVKTSNFWIFQGSEYAANYEYALIANVPGS